MPTKRPQRNRRRRDSDGGRQEATDVIVGRHPVREALRAGRPLERVLIGRGSETGPLASIVEAARKRDIVVRETDRRQLDRLAEGQVHQGVVAVAAPIPYARLEDVFDVAKARGEEPLLLVLDEVQDPHNLGSLLRSADGAGVHGVIVPNRRAAGLTMTVARTSAGAVHHVPVVQVANIARTLATLKDQGLWVVGADMTEADVYWDAPLTGPLAVVIGGEDKGLGRLVRESCDFVVQVPMSGKINSLNAGVAGGLLLFEIARQRRETTSHNRRKG